MKKLLLFSTLLVLGMYACQKDTSTLSDLTPNGVASSRGDSLQNDSCHFHHIFQDSTWHHHPQDSLHLDSLWHHHLDTLWHGPVDTTGHPHFPDTTGNPGGPGGPGGHGGHGHHGG